MGVLPTLHRGSLLALGGFVLATVLVAQACMLLRTSSFGRDWNGRLGIAHARPGNLASAASGASDDQARLLGDGGRVRSTCPASMIPSNVLPASRDGTALSTPMVLLPVDVTTHGRIAFGIKVHDRFDCLDVVIRSIRARHPRHAIFLADDGTTPASVQLKRAGWWDEHMHALELPRDAGTARGRNALVTAAAAASFEFIFVLDDDFALATDVDLARMLRVMDCGGADIVAANRCERMPFDKSNCRGHGSIHRENHTLHVMRDVSLYGETFDGCHRTELVQQAFLGRVSSLRRVQWDDHLKNNDHYDFFLRGLGSGMRVWWCPDMHILHAKLGCYPPTANAKDAYTATRTNRWLSLFPYIANKHNFTNLIDENGEERYVDQVAGSKQVLRRSPLRECAATHTGARALLAKRLGFTSDLTQLEVTHLINAAIPHIYWKVPACLAQLCITDMGPYAVSIRGNLLMQYENRVIWPPEKITVDAKFFARVPISASMVANYLQPLWTHSTAPTTSRSERPLVFVTVTLNSYCYLYRLLSNVRAMAAAGTSIHVVVVDYHSTDGSVEELLHWANATASRDGESPEPPKVKIDVMCGLSFARDGDNGARANSLPGRLHAHLIRSSAHFSRAMGIAAGVDFVRRHVSTHAVVFVADTAIVMPHDMPRRVQRMVACGRSVYAPIARKLLQPPDHKTALRFRGEADLRSPSDAAWVRSGFGMVGFCVSDYAAVGGVELSYGYFHGGEDIDTVERFAAGGLLVLRPEEPGFWHAQHKDASLKKYKRAANPPRGLSAISILVELPPSNVMFRAARLRLMDAYPRHELVSAWYMYPAVSHRSEAFGRVVALLGAAFDAEEQLVMLHAGLGPTLFELQTWDKSFSSGKVCKTPLPPSAETAAGISGDPLPPEQRPRRYQPAMAAPPGAPVPEEAEAEGRDLAPAGGDEDANKDLDLLAEAGV